MEKFNHLIFPLNDSIINVSINIITRNICQIVSRDSSLKRLIVKSTSSAEKHTK